MLWWRSILCRTSSVVCSGAWLLSVHLSQPPTAHSFPNLHSFNHSFTTANKMRTVVWCCFLSIATFATILFQSVEADKLVLVQAIWRHGFRNPKYICPNDENTVGTWYQGLGQMRPEGMLHQMQLGQLMYEEYVTKQKFLSANYSTYEIFCRSTDINQTLLSANANFLGMYYDRPSEKPIVDYPDISEWPSKFVPIAIHTQLLKTDHIGYVNPECPRRDYLEDLVKQTPEVKNYVKSVENLLQEATKVCGSDTTISNIWRLTESYIVENKMNRSHKWLTPEQFSKFRAIERKSLDFISGQGMEPVSTKDGPINFRLEIPRVRSGALIKDIIDHMDHKIRCMDSAYANKNDCSWISKLKYYAYSSHWATIDALLTALEARDKILPASLPGFTATFVIELWKTDAGGFSIRARYRDNPGDKFRNVTSSLPNCNADFCPYDEFKKPVKKYYVNDIVKLCNDVPADWKSTPKKAPETTKQVADENRTNPKLRVKRDVGNAGKKTEAQNGEQLIFIQAFWRHGDRTPTGLCPNDKANVESTWPEGFGQLTPVGMKQQRRLGSLIYKKYVDELKFVDGTYNAHQIYIRATDFNRTIISAMSNFIGMYYNQPQSELDKDYPGNPWPNKFISVPVHTVNRFTDHMGDPNTYCPRQLALMDLAIKSPEVRELEEKNKAFLEKVSKICGMKIGLMSLVMPVDSWYIENCHNRKKIFTDEEYKEMRRLDSIAENVRHGLIKDSVQNGIDLRVQIPRMRGGSQLWDVINHMDQKIYCLENERASEEVCGWYNNLKYFAFSAHDSTLNGLLSALGAKEKVVPDDLPEYTAAVLFELWKVNGQYKVKVNYHRNYNTTQWEDITGNISGCPPSSMCPLEVFKKRSDPFNPGNITTLCYDMSGLPNAAQFTTTSNPINPSNSTPAQLTSSSYLLLLFALLSCVLQW